MRPPAYVYERSHSATRNGSSAGSTPPAKSTAMCPDESAAIARRSMSARAMAMSVSARFAVGARIASRPTCEIGVSSTRPPDATLAVVVDRPTRTSELPSLVESGEVTTKRGTVRAVQLDGQRALVVGGGALDEVDADVAARRRQPPS